MRTWTQFLEDYKDLTDRSEENEERGSTWINDSIRAVCNLQGGKLRFLESTEDIFTVANQQRYQIPNKFRKLIDMYVYSGTGGTSDTIYMPEMVFDPVRWKWILAAKFGTTNVPYFTYVENRTFDMQPIPSQTGNLIVLRGRLQTANLTMPDYTTGTISSVAQDGTTVTGSGTTWTLDMVGRYLYIPQTTAANGGDGFWYEIGGFVNATTITLVKPYQGTSIVLGSASYVIGQCSVIPEAYDIAPLYRAAAIYWQDKANDEKSERYWRMYDGGNEAGYVKEGYGGIIGQMLDNEGEQEEGVYIAPFATTNNIVTNAPYYFPYQQASGFN